MVKDAQAHAEDDKRKQEDIEVRNRADNLIYTTEKVLKENREKVSDSDAASVEKALADARKAVEAGEKDGIEAAIQELTRASHQLSEVLYKSATATPPPNEGGAAPGGSEPGKDGGDVIDAEVVDKK